MTTVIGLHGAKGSGKDYFYQVVKKTYPNLDIRKIAYADPIKHKVMFLFGLETEEQYDEFKRTHLTAHLDNPITQSGRHVVREIGMMMRDYDPQQFVRYVEQTIAAAPQAIWCITDLRFQNELNSIFQLNGFVVKILRAGFEYDGHITETEFPDYDCDYKICNNTTLFQYEQHVTHVFEHILSRAARM